MDSDTKAQLLALRDVFRLTGALHSAQHTQLQYLPRVCIEHSTYAETTIKFSPEDPDQPRVVTMKVKCKGKEPKNLKKCLERMDETVKFLLGADFGLVVEYGKKKFRSPGKANGRHSPDTVRRAGPTP